MGSGRLPTIPSAGAAQAAGGSGARGAPAFVSFNSSGLGGVGASCCFIPFLFFPFFFLPFFQTHFFSFFPFFPPLSFPPFSFRLRQPGAAGFVHAVLRSHPAAAQGPYPADRGGGSGIPSPPRPQRRVPRVRACDQRRKSPFRSCPRMR